jgi:flagellar biosynthetic protein FliP
MRHGFRNRLRWRPALVTAGLLLASGIFLVRSSHALADEPSPHGRDAGFHEQADAGNTRTKGAASPKSSSTPSSIRVNRPADPETPSVQPPDERDVWRTAQNVAIFGLISLAPIGLLMVTAFVRINIVLILLRQALGSPQVPGNQILTALALLLTAIVMRPQAEEVYHKAVEPYAAHKLSATEAWTAGTRPIKAFMVEQIELTNHQDYLQALYDYNVPPSPGRVDPAQMGADELPLNIVAPAYLLSELTTALLMGFYIYLPFLVIDLVVSSVLAATGLFMLPPALVSTPVKLIVFVLADGWLLVATKLLSSFAASPVGP